MRYEHVPLEQLRRRFVAKLGAGEAQASAKLSSGKGLSDLKPFYGHVFDDLLGGCTHWGWVDWDILLGDLAAVVGEEALWASDAVTFAGATLGFAWAGGSRRRRRGGRVEGCPAPARRPLPPPAGQLTIFRNSAETRELYRVDDNHLALGFKAPFPGGVRGRPRLTPPPLPPRPPPQSTGDGQSGWEERTFLRETLRKKKDLTIHFHMGGPA